MKRIGQWTFLALVLVAQVCFATTPLEASLEDLARGADHIVVGRIVGVDMVDASGRPLGDDQDRTGPGVGNTIRLLVDVDEVLVTNAARVSAQLAIPLDPLMHYSLGQIRRAHATTSEPRVFLLRGEDFQPIVAGRFARPLSEKDEALRFHALFHPK